jgi:hypothetical protein
MKGMSEREYSAHSGVSRGAIQKARRSGRLVLHADVSIDAAASDERGIATTDPDQRIRLGGAARSAGAMGGAVGAGGGASASVGDRGPGFSGPADSSSCLKDCSALTVYQAQEQAVIEFLLRLFFVSINMKSPRF